MEHDELLPSSNDATVDTVKYYMSTRNVKSYHLISSTVPAVILLAVSLHILHKDGYAKAFWDTVSAVSSFALVFGVFEIFLRLCHCLLDLTQLFTKHGGTVKEIFASWNLNTASWILLVASFAVFVMLHSWAGNTPQHIWSLGPYGLLPALGIFIILSRVTRLSDSTQNTALAISSMRGVDYGTGMAFSYFYGYLSIILPSNGLDSGLRGNIETYEANHNVTVPVKKLFILIPESGHIPPNLNEASNYWLEQTEKLTSVIKDRAGTKDRPYHNTMYKIHPGGDKSGHRPVYVVTEGATPMLTFWEILQHNHPQTAAYQEHRQQIVISFYETLQMLLNNDPRCRDVCELIFYDEYDANGKKTNVGELLLQRIRAQAGASV